MPRPKSMASVLIGLERRPDAADVAIRLMEREQRELADCRNDVQKWLGDPDISRSALAQHNPEKSSAARLLSSRH
jgi:hypothetical protein